MASIYESFFNTESLNERAPHFKRYVKLLLNSMKRYRESAELFTPPA